MSKLVAHIILAVADIASIFAVVYVLQTWSGITTVINNDSEQISYQSGFCLFLLLLIVPILHLWSLLEAKFKFSASTLKWANRAFIGVFVLFVVFAQSLSWRLDNNLSIAGYHYCAERSESRTFSEFRVYSRAPDSCTAN